MPKPIRFEGGPIFQNSGGMGPDDYLLRPVGSRKPWVKVIFRYGHNFGVKVVDNMIIKPTRPIPPFLPETYEAQRCSQADRQAMGYIFPVEQVHVARNAENERRLAKAGRLTIMTAEDFVKMYGLADDD